MGNLTFYDGYEATQNVVTTLNDAPMVDFILPKRKAVSVKLQNVKAGRKITIYDSRDAMIDDYISIEVIVPSFDPSFYNENVRVTYSMQPEPYRKASYIEIQ